MSLLIVTAQLFYRRNLLEGERSVGLTRRPQVRSFSKMKRQQNRTVHEIYTVPQFFHN